LAAALFWGFWFFKNMKKTRGLGGAKKKRGKKDHGGKRKEGKKSPLSIQTSKIFEFNPMFIFGPREGSWIHGTKGGTHEACRLALLKGVR